MVYKGVVVQHLEVFERAISMLTNFQNNKQQGEVLKLKTIKWDSPPLDQYKLQVDGALFFNLKKVGIGCVVHDSSGKVLLAACKVENNVIEPETIETLILLRNLQLYMHQGFQDLLVESDCSHLVEEILFQQAPSSLFKNVVMDIRNLLLHF